MDEIKWIKFNKQKNHVDILYKLLKKRKNNISHIKMPSFKDHYDFVIKHPYRFWYLIKYKNFFLGSVYFTKLNSIGFDLQTSDTFVIEKIIKIALKKFKPLKPIKSVRPSAFTINLSPTNRPIMKALDTLGAELIELRYTFKNE